MSKSKAIYTSKRSLGAPRELRNVFAERSFGAARESRDFLLKGHSGQPDSHVTFFLKGHMGQPASHVTFLLKVITHENRTLPTIHLGPAGRPGPSTNKNIDSNTNTNTGQQGSDHCHQQQGACSQLEGWKHLPGQGVFLGGTSCLQDNCPQIVSLPYRQIILIFVQGGCIQNGGASSN